MNHRVILGHRADLKPDPVQPFEASQGLILGDIGIVIPDKAAIHCGNIGDDGYQKKYPAA